jgi:amino-acid N-acetyltransferase
MEIRRAESGDWLDVRDLLADSGLPLEGASDAFKIGLVAKDDGRIIGCAAIEPYDGSALLRSIAVAPDHRRTGTGTGLVRAAEELAREGGAESLILLTETAEPWFGRLGYQVIDRSTVPADVAHSIEFATACSTTAVAMRRSLE